jgi:hypothetical protein
MARKKLTVEDIQSHLPIPGLEHIAEELDENLAKGKAAEEYSIPEHIIQAIVQERGFQIHVKGYDQEHDDEGEPCEWFRIVGHHAAEFEYKSFEYHRKEDKDALQVAREGLVKIAAIAVAGIEAMDRQKKAALEAMEAVSPDETNGMP